MKKLHGIHWNTVKKAYVVNATGKLWEQEYLRYQSTLLFRMAVYNVLVRK